MEVLPNLIAVQATAAIPKQWWDAAGGILTIPVTIVGLAYSYALIKKTRLESRKIEIELREKEEQLQELTGGHSDTARKVLEPLTRPLIEGRQTQSLLLRFVILYLIVTSWQWVKALYTYVTGSVYVGIAQSGVINTEGTAAPLVFLAVSYLPDLGYGVVLIAFGWPLFRDANSILGLNVKDFFRWRTKRTNDDDA
jgi:hypothetical protein